MPWDLSARERSWKSWRLRTGDSIVRMPTWRKPFKSRSMKKTWLRLSKDLMQIEKIWEMKETSCVKLWSQHTHVPCTKIGSKGTRDSELIQSSKNRRMRFSSCWSSTTTDRKKVPAPRLSWQTGKRLQRPEQRGWRNTSPLGTLSTKTKRLNNDDQSQWAPASRMLPRSSIQHSHAWVSTDDGLHLKLEHYNLIKKNYRWIMF